MWTFEFRRKAAEHFEDLLPLPCADDGAVLKPLPPPGVRGEAARAELQ